MSFRSITIKRALDQIGRDEYVLPAIQREFVWHPEQIARLFDSILRAYPIGTFLLWTVPADMSRQFRFYDFMRDYHELKSRHSDPVNLTTERPLTAVLDGQQRLTALNIGLHGSLSIRKKYGRASSASSYPRRELYLDVAFDPTASEDPEAAYRLAFLTSDEARPSNAKPDRWFRVCDILSIGGHTSFNRWVQQQGLAEHPSAFDTLNRLWLGVHEREVISYYEDDSRSIDRVLEIFIRTNSGGTVLAKSDLLLSVATAQFTMDARAAVHGLVDDLNATGQGFNFSKDLVLKAGLIITDRPSTGFTVGSFTPENVAALEQQWARIETSLRAGARLLASFGFSDRTLSADSVLLPVADYLAFRGLDERYVYAAAHRADREVLRQWIIRALLKQGVWGSGLDTLVMRIRKVIREHGHNGFPVKEVEAGMAALAKDPRLTALEVEELADTPIGNRRTFPLLALLYPGIDARNEFHIDHVFPKAAFSDKRLTEINVPGDDHELLQDLRDRLPNLQLLEGQVNTSKQKTMPLQWSQAIFPDPVARAGWLAAHDLSHLPEGLDQFLSFYDRRRELIISRLLQLVGPASTAEPSTSPAPAPWLPPPPPSRLPTPTPTPARPDAKSVTPTPPGRGIRGEQGSRSRGTKRQFNRRLADVPDGPVEYKIKGVVHLASVRGDQIVLSDGRSFDSPSTVGVAVNGNVSVNGWKVWKRGDQTLADLVD